MAQIDKTRCVAKANYAEGVERKPTRLKTAGGPAIA